MNILGVKQNKNMKIFNINREWNKMSPFEFWSEIGSPRYVCGPMVDQSELPFRMIARKYGTELTFTPMIHSVCFTTMEKYREKWLKDLSQEEGPCFVQFCGHDPEILLQAAKYVEDKTPCIDLNLGCPQGIARKGNYGAFLLENEELVIKILSYLSNNLKCAVSCKIRLFKDLDRSFEYVKKIEQTGVKVITVHGRTKHQNKHLVGTSNWDAIRYIKESVNIPVIANGGVETYEDIEKCFEATKCDAVMSAEKILENPFIFSGQMLNIDDVAIEYITLADELDTDINFCRSHLFKFFYQACKMNFEFNERLSVSHSYKDLLYLAYEIKEYRKDVKNEDKFGWYYRYRKEENPYKESLSFKKKSKADELQASNKSDTNDLSNMFN